MENLNDYFVTIGTIAALTVIIATFLIDKVLKWTKRYPKMILTWLVAIALTFIGNLLNLGFAAEFPWLTTAVYGLGVGLVANGIFDVPTVQVILEFLKLKKVKEVK